MNVVFEGIMSKYDKFENNFFCRIMSSLDKMGQQN